MAFNTHVSPSPFGKNSSFPFNALKSTANITCKNRVSRESVGKYAKSIFIKFAYMLKLPVMLRSSGDIIAVDYTFVHGINADNYQGAI